MVKNNVFNAAILAALFAVISNVNGQSMQGCNFNEIMKVQRLSSAMMGCVGLSLSDVTSFAASLSSSGEMERITNCVEDPLSNQQDCMEVATVMAELGAHDATSVPAIISEHILSDPIGTCGCNANLFDSSYRNMRDSCATGAQLNAGLDQIENLCNVVIENDPWQTPKIIEGCSSTDAMRFNLLGLQYAECLNIEINPDDVERLLEEIPDQTEALNQIMDCARDPKANHMQCVDLINRVSESVSKDNSLSAQVLSSLLVDPTTMCNCAQGLGYTETATAISEDCQAKKMVTYLQAADESCAYLAALEAKAEDTFEGCDTSDLINSQLAGIQTIDCLQLDPKAVQESASNYDIERINQIGDCLQDLSTNNEDCRAILEFFSNSATLQDTVSSQVAQRLQYDSENFCRCINTASLSLPATSIHEQCVASDWLGTLQASQATCSKLSQVDPSAWASLIKYDTIDIELTSAEDTSDSFHTLQEIEIVEYSSSSSNAFGIKKAVRLASKDMSL